jgi:hypothetical protein
VKRKTPGEDLVRYLPGAEVLRAPTIAGATTIPTKARASSRSCMMFFTFQGKTRLQTDSLSIGRNGLSFIRVSENPQKMQVAISG